MPTPSIGCSVERSVHFFLFVPFLFISRTCKDSSMFHALKMLKKSNLLEEKCGKSINYGNVILIHIYGVWSILIFGLRNVGQRFFKGWYLSLMHVTLDKFNVCSRMPQFINKKTIFHNIKMYWSMMIQL